MEVLFYDFTFAASVLLTALYMLIWHKHFDVHITLVYVLVAVCNLGYFLLAHADNPESAILALKLTYIGGCYTILMLLFAVFSLCHVKLPTAAKMTFMTLSTITYFSALTIGHSTIFYKSITAYKVNGVYLFKKDYAFMHSLFYFIIFLYFTLAVIVIVYSYFKKKHISNQIILLLFLPEFVAMVSFFGGRQLTNRIELIPAAYDIALILYLIIIHRLSLYDISDTAIDSMVETGSTGFVSFDYNLKYLGSNKTARSMMPELKKLVVDQSVADNEFMQKTAVKWLDDFVKDEKNDQAYYETGDKTYLVKINHLFDGRHRRGYQLFLTDDTPNQQYITLLSNYNTDLQKEVEEKTQHIVDMHDRLIMSMATMVESRDNSTGGHIRRTSEGVRILMGEISKGGEFEITDEFTKDIIKAAPMHDLGKIAVDDAILRKPGRFTDEEFNVMKTHAAEGARIVREILKDTDDRDFARIAENVAHYHHERWDGSGYPEGLKGEEIPLEARIMAIADVYDALVSKRVYKEKMSFEKADSIIMEGMGKHFDKRLEPYYVAARPGLEAYYSRIDA